MAKAVAQTLKSILDHEHYDTFMNRKKPLWLHGGAAIQDVISWWNLDLFKRKPGPALDTDGTFKGTDLDLATFMYALAQRGAVVNLPEYKRMRAATKREGERVISSQNRHGQVTNRI